MPALKTINAIVQVFAVFAMAAKPMRRFWHSRQLRLPPVALSGEVWEKVAPIIAINMLIWSYGIFQGLGFLTLTYVVMNFLAIRKPYAADSSTPSDDESAVFEDIWNETMTVIGAQAFSFAILYTNYPSWEKSQKMASEPADEAPEEEEVAPEEDGEGEVTEEGPAEDQGEVESFMINF